MSNVLIGVVGNENPPRRSTTSISRMAKPPNTVVVDIYDTLGHVARQRVVMMYLSDYVDTTEWLLLLDSDMVFDENTLQRMLATASTGKKVVSGLYYRREADPPFPIVFDDDPEFRWPMRPLWKLPSETEPFTCGGTGFGCLLIHRDVLLDMQDFLHGEPIVSIDDLAWWPHDVTEIDRLIEDIHKETQQPTVNVDTIAQNARDLRTSMRPLRGLGDRYLIGGDIRFCFYARHLGYPVWIDPLVRPSHVAQVEIGHDFYELMNGQERNNHYNHAVLQARKRTGVKPMSQIDTARLFFQEEIKRVEKQVQAFEAKKQGILREANSYIEQLRQKHDMDRVEQTLVAMRASLSAYDLIENPDKLQELAEKRRQAQEPKTINNVDDLSRAAGIMLAGSEDPHAGNDSS